MNRRRYYQAMIDKNGKFAGIINGTSFKDIKKQLKELEPDYKPEGLLFSDLKQLVIE